jgi:DNA-directed RNA polymerase specialized sigma24 family protein
MATKVCFPTTQWSVIRRAQAQGPDARSALEQLIRRYDGFVGSFFGRSWRPPHLALDDVKQDFLLRLLQDLPGVVEGRGKFRGWLYCAMGSYLSNARRRWWATSNASRHTDCVDLPEQVTLQTAEDELLRSFAVDTLRYAKQLLRARVANPPRFEALQQFLPGPDMDLEQITVVASRMNLPPVTARKAIHDLREQFRECLHEAVADTLDPQELTGDGVAIEALMVERELREHCAALFPAWSSELAFVR